MAIMRDLCGFLSIDEKKGGIQLCFRKNYTLVRKIPRLQNSEISVRNIIRNFSDKIFRCGKEAFWSTAINRREIMKMKTKINLLPCKRCKSKDSLGIIRGRNGICWVHCYNYGCQYDGPKEIGEKEARIAWNTDR